MDKLKVHVALNVTNLEKSIKFYRAMFGASPAKYKKDYAKFDIASPPLNLTLNLTENINQDGGLNHLGIQVLSSEEVESAIKRFKESGLTLFEEKDRNCCYALQDKVWVTDPDGNRWEIFYVKTYDTAPEQEVSLSF